MSSCRPALRAQQSSWAPGPGPPRAPTHTSRPDLGTPLSQPAGRAGPDPGGFAPGVAARSLVFGVLRAEGWDPGDRGGASEGVAQHVGVALGARARGQVPRRRGRRTARDWKAGRFSGVGEGRQGKGPGVVALRRAPLSVGTFLAVTSAPETRVTRRPPSRRTRHQCWVGDAPRKGGARRYFRSREASSRAEHSGTFISRDGASHAASGASGSGEGA